MSAVFRDRRFTGETVSAFVNLDMGQREASCIAKSEGRYLAQCKTPGEARALERGYIDFQQGWGFIERGIASYELGYEMAANGQHMSATEQRRLENLC